MSTCKVKKDNNLTKSWSSRDKSWIHQSQKTDVFLELCSRTGCYAAGFSLSQNIFQIPASSQSPGMPVCPLPVPKLNVVASPLIHTRHFLLARYVLKVTWERTFWKTKDTPVCVVWWVPTLLSVQQQTDKWESLNLRVSYVASDEPLLHIFPFLNKHCGSLNGFAQT